MEKQLPKNWVECSLGEIIQTKKGKKPSSTIDHPKEGYVPYILIDEMEGKPIRSYTNDANVSIVNEDEVLLVWDGSIGKCGSGLYGAIGSTLVALKPLCNIPTKFIEYTLIDKNSFIKQTSTGTGLQHINKNFFKDCVIGLPPLAEQNRIVAKLDTLFIQLETIKTSMENIPILLKDFRQQVLTQAVTGKLTEEWRKGKELGEWRTVNIEILVNSLKTDIRTGPFGSALKKDEHKNEGIPVWGIESIGLNGKFTGVNKIFVSQEKAAELKSFEVKGGNIIISRSGTVGELCILPDNVEYGLISTNLMKIILNNNIIISKYFCWLFKGSQIVIDRLNDLCKGSTRLFLTQTILKNLDFPLPSLKEQQEIVRRVESLFAKADGIEQQYKSLKQKIDTLPQAILHKAFKGELTEQLDSDGDAKELLRQIKKLKEATNKGAKNTKLEKLKEFNKKRKRGYKEKEEVLNMVAEPKEEFYTRVVKLKPTNSEIYKRTLLAAEIVYQLKDTKTLGHLKLQKMLYLCQEIGSMNLPMNFLKQAMGPYDNQLARSLDKQFVVKKWFEYQNGALLKYKPLENCGNHNEDFQKYFETEVEQINYLINKFNKFTSNQIEAVATLYACWKEAIKQNELITDKLIITKFYQWSKEKEKFREENMYKALDWMRRNGVEPK